MERLDDDDGEEWCGKVSRGERQRERPGVMGRRCKSTDERTGDERGGRESEGRV